MVITQSIVAIPDILEPYQLWRNEMKIGILFGQAMIYVHLLKRHRSFSTYCLK